MINVCMCHHYDIDFSEIYIAMIPLFAISFQAFCQNLRTDYKHYYINIPKYISSSSVGVYSCVFSSVFFSVDFNILA